MPENFSSTLFQWYAIHKRELPWREESNPYRIWISEIILQQTRVAQGWNNYERFIKTLPDIQSIYESGEQEVLKYWQGLGYYTRARNIYAGAVYIMEKHEGRFPQTYDDILKIKGVGEYTAAAIASFAFQLPYPVIDGNVLRVISRIFGVYEPIDSSSGKKKITTIINELINKKQPGTFNQAMMDFGATLCTSLKPECELCCFSPICYAKLHYEQHTLPIKKTKIQTKNRYFNYLVIHEGKSLYIQKRNTNDIWKGLFEFPLWETPSPLPTEEIYSHPYLSSLFGKINWTIKNISAIYKHVLSHQIINTQFIHIHIEKSIHNSKYLRINANEIENYPVSRLMERYIETNNLNI